MKSGRKIILILVLNLAGCSYLEHSVQNLVSAPVDTLQECLFRMRIRRIARSAWRRICSKEGAVYSSQFARGFEDGFVDYVDRGGTGEAATPPVHLQREGLRSLAAQQAIEEWYAGFRLGAATAKDTGLRERILVPIGLPPRPDSELTVTAQRSAPIGAGQGANVRPTTPQTLPFSRATPGSPEPFASPEPAIKEPVSLPRPLPRGAQFVAPPTPIIVELMPPMISDR